MTGATVTSNMIHDGEAGVNQYSHMPDNTMRYSTLIHSREEIFRYDT